MFHYCTSPSFTIQLWASFAAGNQAKPRAGNYNHKWVYADWLQTLGCFLMLIFNGFWMFPLIQELSPLKLEKEINFILLNVIPAQGIYWAPLIAGGGNGIGSISCLTVSSYNHSLNTCRLMLWEHLSGLACAPSLTTDRDSHLGFKCMRFSPYTHQNRLLYLRQTFIYIRESHVTTTTIQGIVSGFVIALLRLRKYLQNTPYSCS